MVGYGAKACLKLNKPKEKRCFTCRGRGHRLAVCHQRANNQIEEDIRDSEEGSDNAAQNYGTAQENTSGQELILVTTATSRGN
jgi:hypothetical protein